MPFTLHQLSLIPRIPQLSALVSNLAGSELEEYRIGELPIDDKTTLGLAIERTQCLLQGSIDIDDELLADTAFELDQRALDKIRTFISTLAENEAIYALQYRNHVFRFTDVDQARRSLERLSKDNLHEDEQLLKGEFQGVLPKRRTFEFKITGSDQIIIGKVTPAIEGVDLINKRLHHQVEIRTMVTQVGDGRPRYLLLDLPHWND